MANGHNTTHFKGLPLGIALIDGGTAGDHTVAGITTKDTLISVHSLASSTDVLSTADLTSEFSITAANTVNNTGGTSSANGALLVMWQKGHPNS